MQRLILTVQEESGIERRAWPVTRGVPLPQGAVAECDDLWLEDARGRAVTLQSRPLSHWPDGSIKWVLVDFQADVVGSAVYHLCYAGEAPRAAPGNRLQISESDKRIVVCTGPLRFAVSRRRYGLVHAVSLGRQEADGFVEEVAVSSQGGDSWADICEAFE
ncbi:MAG: hypothetical protein J4F29_21215, partial [Candidatus Latescibacteria bacterium]|nr:hypothetical protein [Candidatus Latescibacterota bacterium]